MAASSIESEQNIREAAHDWRARMVGQTVSDAERRAFEAWLAADSRHEAAYDRAVTIWAALAQVERDDYRDAVLEPLWREQVIRFVQSVRGAFEKSPKRIMVGAASALALAIGVMVLPSMMSRPGPVIEQSPVSVRHATAIGETKLFSLDDGTRVTVGPGSTIDTTYSEGARRVFLRSGAAYFDVAHDPVRPFSVSAGDLTATALGTAFDVRNNGGVFRVAVAEGEVRVSFPFVLDQQPTNLPMQRSLTAGEQITAELDRGLRPVRAIALDAVGAWREARLVYDQATIAELVDDANRYSETPVEIAPGSEAIARLKLTGSFSGDDIGEMLRTLEQVHSVEIDMSDPAVVRLRAR